MKDKDKAAALAEMRERRIEAVRERTWRETAIALLNEHGRVDAAAVEAAVAEVVIDEAALADQMAAKAAAAVVQERRMLESAREAVAGVEAKIAKYEAMVAEAKAALREAKAEVEAIEVRVADAEELAEYAAQLGDADAAPPSVTTSAKAGSASATGKAGA